MSACTLETTLICTRVFKIVCHYKTEHMHAYHAYIVCVLHSLTNIDTCIFLHEYVHICTGSWMDAIHAIIHAMPYIYNAICMQCHTHTHTHTNTYAHADTVF